MHWYLVRLRTGKGIRPASKQSAMEASLQELLMFNGENYDDWSQRMKGYLKTKDFVIFIEKSLSDILTEYAVEPDDSNAVKRRKEEEAKEIRRREGMCSGELTMRMGRNVLELIKGIEEAKVIWDTLVERYKRVSAGTRLLLSKKLNLLKYRPHEISFNDYNTKYDALVRELKETGSVMSDFDIVSRYIWTLPQEYEGVITSIRTVETSKLTLSFVRNLVEEFELTRQSWGLKKGGGKASSPSTAFTATRSTPYQKDRLICHNCSRPNHYARDCTRFGGGAYKNYKEGQSTRGSHHQSSTGRGGAAGHSGQPGSSSGYGESKGTPFSRGGANFRGGNRGGGGGSTFRGNQRGRNRGYGSFRGGRDGGSAAVAESGSSAINTADDAEAEVAYSFLGNTWEINEVSEIITTKESLSDDVSFVSQGDVSNIVFILDSGASRHLVKPGVPVTHVRKLSAPVMIRVAKSKVCLYSFYEGRLECISCVNGLMTKFNISVLIVPNLSHNLMSISTLDKKGYKITFFGGQSLISLNGNIVAQGEITGTLYHLTMAIEEPSVQSLIANNADVWHKRLGHLGKQNLKLIQKMVDGIDGFECVNNDMCDVCVEGKQTRQPFPGTRPKTSRPLERVHSDLCGPISPTAYTGVKYIFTLIDDFTHFTVVYGLKGKTKEEVLSCMKHYEAAATARFSSKISKFRCDNGSEFVNEAVKEFFTEKGIEFELTIPGHPENNGVAERLNRTVLDKGRCLMLGCSLNKTFWIEAVNTAVYLLNRSPTRALDQGKVPAELWYGVRPNLSKLRVFGCVAFVCKTKEQLKGKFDSRSKKCIFLGYCDNGYRLWSIAERKVITARDVVFDESRSKFINGDDWVYDSNIGENNQDMDIDNEDVEDDANGEVHPDEPDEPADGEGEIPYPELEEVDEETQRGELRRTTRVRMRPRYLQDYAALSVVARIVDTEYDPEEETGDVFCMVSSEENDSVGDVPSDFSEIHGRGDRRVWIEAVKEELQALEENNTWDLVKLPPSTRPINSKWVFAVKLDSTGNVDRYKARLVVKGCAQRPGIDFSETYAPVARLPSVRLFLCLANKDNMHVTQLDVKCAFLNGDLKEDIYMWAPEGLNVEGDIVCKLNKTLYGLKQAPMEWNHKFNECMKSLGFYQCKADQCLYVLNTNNVIVYLILYVDDVLLASKCLDVLNKIKESLMSTFKMRDLGKVSSFLGIRVQQSEQGLFLNQEVYINKVISKFDMTHASNQKVKTPLEPNPNLALQGECIVGSKPYRSLIGNLMYACMSTRPDICAAINIYSQYQVTATLNHWKGLKRILRYLRGTPEWGLWYRGSSEHPLELYVDADFANEPGRKSVSGFIVKMYGDSIHWGTRKQTSVALSSTEAEFVALATGVSELLWLKTLISELGINVDRPINVYEDNQSCIFALNNWEVKRLKHIDIKYNFVKDLCRNKIINVQYLSTTEQPADVMTKGLPCDQFVKHRENLGMCKCP